MDFIANMLTSAHGVDEKQLYDLSMEIEPRKIVP